MKVLFVSNDRLIFREDSSVRARMREYAALFGELHIVARAPKGTRYTEDGPLILHPVEGNKLQGLLRMEGAARRIIREKSIEIVSAQDPFEQGFVALGAVRGTKTKLHIQIHTDFLSPGFTGFLNLIRIIIAGWVLPRAQGIRTVSQRIADSVVRRYGARVVMPSVVPLTVRLELPSPAPLPTHRFSFAFVTIARLEKEKRIEDILHALTQVREDAGLIIIGDGSERRRLEVLAVSLGLMGRVLFMGWRTDASALMQGAQAYVQASAYEGYGRTLVEAALASLPIITTDVGIVGDVLRDKMEALVVAPKDVAALAVCMSSLVQDAALCARLGEAAGKSARTHIGAAGNLAEAVRDDLACLLV